MVHIVQRWREAEAWFKELSRSGVNLVLLDRRDDHDLVVWFASQTGWRLDYEDDQLALFARQQTAHEPGCE